jgi:hypothetical protein
MNVWRALFGGCVMRFRLSATTLSVVGLLLAMPAIGSASPVNLLYDLDLNGMTTGTCPGGVCGQVTVTGDTTTSLAYAVALATGVSFHANHAGSSGTGPFFYFQLTDPGGPAITFSGLGVNGTIGTDSYSYNTPTTTGGPFTPNAGNFPGTYNYVVTCTNDTSGKICNGPLTFTASGATVANPFIIGSPLGHGLFPTDEIAFVADLSVSGLCGQDVLCTAGTGLVGSSLVRDCPTCGPDIATPLPGALPLFVSGLGAIGGLIGWRRKRKSAIASA